MNKKILTILTVILILPILSVSSLAVESYIYDYSFDIWYADSGGNEIGSVNNIYLADSGSTYNLEIGTYTLYESIYLYAYDTKFGDSCLEASERVRVVRERYFYEEDLGYTKSAVSETHYPESYASAGTDQCQLDFNSATYNGHEYTVSDDLTSPSTGDSYIEGKDRLDIVYYAQVLQ